MLRNGVMRHKLARATLSRWHPEECTLAIGE